MCCSTTMGPTSGTKSHLALHTVIPALPAEETEFERPSLFSQFQEFKARQFAARIAHSCKGGGSSQGQAPRCLWHPRRVWL